MIKRWLRNWIVSIVAEDIRNNGPIKQAVRERIGSTVVFNVESFDPDKFRTAVNGGTVFRGDM